MRLVASPPPVDDVEPMHFDVLPDHVVLAVWMAGGRTCIVNRFGNVSKIYEPRRVGGPHQLASGRRLKLARLQTCDAPQITRSNFDGLRGLSGRLDRRRGPHPIAGPQERDQYQ